MANGARGDPGVNGGGDTAPEGNALRVFRASSVPLTGVLLMIRADPTIVI